MAGRWTSCLIVLVAAGSAFGQAGTRDLSGFAGPAATFTVNISLNVPPNTQVAGYEDRPPDGWIVSNISDSGSFDLNTRSIKWGLYLEPSIPTAVSYDVTTPADVFGANCFEGSASYDGSDETIEGDRCLPVGVPAASAWSVASLSLLLLACATVIIRRTNPVLERS